MEKRRMKWSEIEKEKKRGSWQAGEMDYKCSLTDILY